MFLIDYTSLSSLSSIKTRSNILSFKRVSLLHLLILLIFFSLTFTLPEASFSLPVWPESKDPNGNDIIGFEDADVSEFCPKFDSATQKIEFNVGDDWNKFPSRLKPKSSSFQPFPHTLTIIFEANQTAEVWNISMCLFTNDPNTSQFLSIFFDEHSLHPAGGEKIQMGKPFTLYTFWLGTILPGRHTITLGNETPIESNFGIFFDYVKFESAAQNETIIENASTSISEVIKSVKPGDTIIVKKGIYKEQNGIILKSGIILRSGSEDDLDELDPANVTVIDSNGKTAIYGAYQAQIKGFTIQDASNGIVASHDLMTIAHNIIHSCQKGALITGQGIEFLNNTIAKTDIGVYSNRANPNAPIPSLICKNNIMSDSNFPLYIDTNQNAPNHIASDKIKLVVKEFSYNNIATRLLPKPENMISFKNGNSGGNIRSDPFFIDQNHDNYHLCSYSPCIDAGDPNSHYLHEPEYNGGRINLGAFGNTSQAETTVDSDGDGIWDYIDYIDGNNNDNNKNGAPDWNDNQAVIFFTSTGKGFISPKGEGKISLSIPGDQHLPATFRQVTALDLYDPHLSCSKGLPPEMDFLYGLWEFALSGIGADTMLELTIYFPEDRFYDFLEYYTYNPEQGWEKIEVKKYPSRSALSIKFLYNARSHVGGIAKPSSFTLGKEYNFKKCFISNL